MGKDVIIACDFKNKEELFKFLAPFKGLNPFLKMWLIFATPLETFAYAISPDRLNLTWPQLTANLYSFKTFTVMFTGLK